jgi:hypothetical protein
MAEEVKVTRCQDGSRCGGKGTTRQRIPPGKKWVCIKCQAATYTVPVMKEIKTKMTHLHQAPGDANRFPIRELVQNADDAYADTVVIRAEKDALYFANNGHAFRSREGDFPGDWVRLLCVLGGGKEGEVESTGRHGSGFQTVYHFTNHPEIFSAGESIKLDPTNPNENGRIIPLESRNEKGRRSPYGLAGALFRFPWRTEEEANRVYFGERPFAREFAVWNEDSILSFTEDLRDYLHDLILCCQRVRVARIIWGSPPAGFEVRRTDFKLADPVLEECFYRASVEEGMVEVPSDWEEGFAEGESRWRSAASGPKRTKYLIGASFVADEDGRRLYYGVAEGGKEHVTSEASRVMDNHKGPFGKNLKFKGNIHVIIPLFNDDDTQSERASGYYKYSVLPIPYRTRNMFACTAHLFVDEARASLILSDQNKVWFLQAMKSLGRLYLKTFEEYLRTVQSLPNEAVSRAVKQRIVLDAIPGTPLPTWISPKEIQESEFSELFKLDKMIMKRLVNLRILLSGDSWVEPVSGMWIEDDQTASLVRRLGIPVFGQDFVRHERFERIRSNLEDNRFREEDFLTAWNEFSKSNPGILKLGQELADATQLDQDLVERLINHCLGSNIPEIRALPIVPDRNGILRPIDDYPFVPEGYEGLNNLLRDERRINDAYVKKVRSYDSRTATANDVLTTLSAEIEGQSHRFEKVGDSDLRLLSEVVSKAVRDTKFAISAVSDCRFIPYQYQGYVRVGEPNKVNRVLFKETEHAGERYRRDFIFGEQRLEIPYLTEEIRRGIRILTLPGLDEKAVAEVETHLYLVALQETKKSPTNFVRAFISPKSERGSLFDDRVLSDFLAKESDIKRIDSRMLQKQKIALLKIAQSYFKSPFKGTELDRETMSKVPMLYDSEGNWKTPSDFAYDLDDTMRMFGKSALHPDFKDEDEWPKRVLVDRLGVCETMTVGEVASAIVKLKDDPSGENRKKLSVICGYLLTSTIPLANDNGVRLSDLPELKNVKWIPTLDGGLAEAESCLLPTERNKRALGPDFELFVELPKDVLDRIDTEQILERAISIGIRRIAPRELLLETVQKYYRTNRVPPEALFDELSKEEVTPGYPDATYERPFGKPVYYSAGKWWKQQDIRMMNEQDVPNQLKDRYLIIQEGISNESARHVRYLRYFLGVETAFTDEEILELMKQGGMKIDMSLWTLLAKSKHISDDLMSSYGGQRIFPRPDNREQLLKPDHIILKGGLFTDSGDWGDFYVLEKVNLDRSLVTILKELGAREGDSLDASSLSKILYGMSWTGRIRDDGRYVRMMKLIQRIANLCREGKEVRLDQRCIPIRLADGLMECRTLDECYKSDHFRARMFMGHLPIPEATVGDEYDRTLEAFFVENCGKSFKEELSPKPTFEPSEPEKDKDQEIRFHEIGRALSRYIARLGTVVGSDFADVEKSIRWLAECSVNRYDNVSVKYEVGGFEQKTSGYHIDVTKDRLVTIDLARFAEERIRGELPLEILNTCQAKRPSKELADRKDQVLGILTQLLFSDDLRTWSYIVPDYRYEGNSPIIAPLVEILETTEGYPETRSELRKWYGACQICLARTPAGEKSDDTCETVTSIVSLRGGRYPMKIDSYSPGQCLFLCPTHQTLYQRGLVKVPYLEPLLKHDRKKAEELLRAARTRAGRHSDSNKPLVEFWEVYESPVSEAFALGKKGWEHKNIRFRREHLLKMIDYIEKRMEEWKDE